MRIRKWTTRTLIAGGTLTIVSSSVVALSALPLLMSSRANLGSPYRTGQKLPVSTPSPLSDGKKKSARMLLVEVGRDRLPPAPKSVAAAFDTFKARHPDRISGEQVTSRIAAAHGTVHRASARFDPVSTFEVATLVTELPGFEPPADAMIAELVPETVPTPQARPKVRFTRRTESAEKPVIRQRPNSSLVMAYANATATEESEESRGLASIFKGTGRATTSGWPGKGTRTAVYDISAGVVYMPNGQKLEAHSGMGHMRDNPRYTHVKMRGATPPAVYNLRMRESRFHGVEAIRLLPANGVNPRGRTGLLAHTYMLRTPGDSNGCLVFPNYNKFLNAFKAGKINRLVAVENLPKSHTQIAEIFPD